LALIVYTAFSPEAVKDRMKDAGSHTLITADGFYRGGKTIELKKRIDDVLDEIDADNSIVVNRAETDPEMKEGRDTFTRILLRTKSRSANPNQLTPTTQVSCSIPQVLPVSRRE